MKNKLLKEVDKDGTIRYYNENKKFHRKNGPAVEYVSGSKEWWKNGKLHREDGPAIEYANGVKEWHLDGKEISEEEFLKIMSNKPRKEVDQSGTIFYYNNKKQLHREDGPAVEYADGEKHWFKNGKYHREDGPAKEYPNGDKYWCKNGKLHREDGPAREYPNGDKEWCKNGKYHRENGPAIEYLGIKSWYKNGKLHREDGPAKEYPSGKKDWYIDGKLHREDGPAIEYPSGKKEWYIDGKKLSKKEFLKTMQNKPRKEVDKDGTIRYYNNKKQLHREDGPAVEYADGEKHWYKNGKHHRENGPAVEHADGYKAWWRNGKFHREDGPAVEHADGYKAWWRNGKFHREDGPAVEHADGSKAWYKNGKLHREDGPAIEHVDSTKLWYLDGERLSEEEFLKTMQNKPRKQVDQYGTIRYYNNKNELHREGGHAIEYANGDKSWYKNGLLHREDGPAIEHVSGRKSWWINGSLHREDGPAVEYPDGKKEWYIDGEELSEKEFFEKTKSNKNFHRQRVETNTEVSTSITEKQKMSNQSFADMFKADLTKASYNVAANQITVGLQQSLLMIFANKGATKEQLVGIEAFFKSEYGKALIQLVCGFALTYAPIDVIQSDSRAQKLAESFRVKGMETVGNEVVGVAIQHFVPVIMSALNNIPPSTNNEKIRVKKPEELSSKEDFIDGFELEDISDANKLQQLYLIN